LASYPKSGNTWFRIFLSNLLFPSQAPVNPSQLPMSNLIASARQPFDEILGFKSSLLTSSESATFRPQVDAVVASEWPEKLCLRKTHDAYTFLSDGRPLMGRRSSFKAIYILRDPWDVAVSAANHWNVSLDEAVSQLCDSRDDGWIDKDINEQFPQHWLSWSDHVLSWIESLLDLTIIRYEEMHKDPLPTFRRAIEFLDLDHDDDAILRAIEASSFSRIQRIETKSCFSESPRKGMRFFRKGVVGEGLSLLSSAQISRLKQQALLVEERLTE